jgi:hypothetical protein
VLVWLGWGGGLFGGGGGGASFEFGFEGVEHV